MRARMGFWVVAVALLLAIAVQIPFGLSPRAYGAEGAKYMGPKLCVACHRGTHSEVIEAVSGSTHQRAMWKVEDEDKDHPLVADFASDPPFPKEKIAYVLGVGRKYQSYLDADLQVLPGEWFVKDDAWRPRDAVDATRECLGCHTTGFDPETKEWAAPGVTCEMCHGPGSVHAASADKNETIVRPQSLDPARRVMICGQCHSQGKSKDGAYAFPAAYYPGDDLGQYFVLDAEVDPDAVNTQYNELVQGAKHLAGGTVCTTCHEAHGSVEGLPRQLRAATNDLCLNTECHGGELSGAQHEPAALQAVTCSICHMPKGKHSFAVPDK
jgi:predicted CXXCH cytochrome family protein